MNAINLIAKHISHLSSDAEIENVDAICAFTGQQITQGIKLKKSLSGNFVDYDYIKHDSAYISIDAFKCLKANVQVDEKLRELRTVRFYANEDELFVITKYQQVIDFLFDENKKTPFVLCIGDLNSSMCRSNLTYRAVLNHDPQKFIVTTEQALVNFNHDTASTIYSIAKKWYQIKSGISPYFTKEEIRTGNASFARIEEYGADTFFKENEILEKHRRSNLFELIVKFLKSNEDV